jgi:hypothetical protein
VKGQLFILGYLGHKKIVLYNFPVCPGRLDLLKPAFIA